MIIKVHKYLIFGAREDLDLFYERAQKAGWMEFISSKKTLAQPPEEIQKLISALKVLKGLPPFTGSQKMIEQDASLIAQQILDLKIEIEKQEEEKRVVELEKARIAPFGDFSAEDVEYLRNQGHVYVQFFCARASVVQDVEDSPNLVYLGTENDLSYFISIHPHITNYPLLTEVRIEHTVGQLAAQSKQLETSVSENKKKLENLSSYFSFLQEELLKRLNAYHLVSAKEEAINPLTDEPLFSAEAWIPESKLSLIPSLIEGLAVECEKIAIEEQDRVPTVMENQGINRIGEDLVKFYDTPSLTDKDPSGWLFWAFALFFAIIVADAGYGLLFLGLAAYTKWKVRTFHGIGKRLFRLFVILSLFVVGWGVMTSSFFGLDLSVNNPLRKIAPFTYLVEAKAEYHLQKKDDVYQEYVEMTPAAHQATTGREFVEFSTPARKDFADSILLEIALIVGIVHIFLGMARYMRRNLANIGWMIFLIGAYLFFPTTLNASSLINVLGWMSNASAYAVGEKMVFGGFILAIILGIIQKKWKGILEIMNVIQISADVLSYLRLYALAIASSIMASSFNDMGKMAGILGGSLVIIAGHLINMSLGTMSGVIHGLRLNVIEWYRYSFEGGGKIFNPLKILKSKED